MFEPVSDPKQPAARRSERQAAQQESWAELPRRERRKLEVRARILEAAFELFEQQGYLDTKVTEISDRADVAHKTFFNHFPSKQHLLREIAMEGLQHLLVDIEDARKHAGSTPERLMAFFTLIADNAEERGPMQRELLTELIHFAHESGTGNEQALKLQQAFGAIVEDGLAHGDVTTAHAPETLTEMILGAFYALMFSFANLEDYPLRARAIAAADFLGDALSNRDRAGERT
jgi:AcrR family transcriptional regulator